jgi:hypothetical protein
MPISVFVPYDEDRLRRTLRFLLHRRLRRVRWLGALLIVLSLFVVFLDPTDPVGYGFGVLGLFFTFALEPTALRRSMRIQAHALKAGFHLTADDEFLTIAYPLVESRFRWAGLGRVKETPDVWYIMFGRIQVVTIPKHPMTEEQRADFAALLTRRPSTVDTQRP